MQVIRKKSKPSFNKEHLNLKKSQDKTLRVQILEIDNKIISALDVMLETADRNLKNKKYKEVEALQEKQSKLERASAELFIDKLEMLKYES